MRRREFLHFLGGLGLWPVAPGLALAAGPRIADRLLILVELKGGNDGLNTVVPYADPAYYALRPHLALARDAVLPLGERFALHPSLAPLLPLWQANELAILHGVGYPGPNLSHFRSVEIWDTAARSDQYLAEGWLARVFSRTPLPPSFAADGAVIGSQEMGPLSGGRRVVMLNDPERFVQQARGLQPMAEEARAANPALAHIQRVAAETRAAAAQLGANSAPFRFATEFPAGEFGRSVHTACQVLGGGSRVAVLRLTLNGFDTHRNQPGIQSNLLQQLAGGLAALRAALVELGLWQRTLVVTVSEFGRRPQENGSNGTDHGTAAAHFALGGMVRGGFHGAAPELARIDANGNLSFTTDFRSIYATLLERWWGVDSREVLGGCFAPLNFVV